VKDMNVGEDRLRTLDFDAAFPETPVSIGEAIRMAGGDIERYELRRVRRTRRVIAAAAVLVLGVGVAAAIYRLGGAPDSVVPPRVTAVKEPVSEVYSSKDDPFYHVVSDCEAAGERSVALTVETAIEFEKKPCPVCVDERTE